MVFDGQLPYSPGSVGLTLRHRLLSVVKTAHEVKTADQGEECPLSPTEAEKPRVSFQKFPSRVVIPTENLRTRMLVCTKLTLMENLIRTFIATKIIL